MEREEEWEEIEKSIKDKDNEIIKKYGIDITKQFNESIKEENIIKRKKERWQKYCILKREVNRSKLD